MMNEATYWMALAHLPRWGHLKINNLIIKFHHEFKITIDEFFNLSENEWRTNYLLDPKQILDLQQAKTELASNALMVLPVVVMVPVTPLGRVPKA